MKQKVRTVTDLLIGSMLLISVVLGYYRDWSYAGEYCCLSGLAAGVIFLSSFLCRFFWKKELPVWLFFDAMIALFMIPIGFLLHAGNRLIRKKIGEGQEQV